MPCGYLKEGKWHGGANCIFPFEEIRVLYRDMLIKGLIKSYKKGELNLGTSYPQCIDEETFGEMLNGYGLKKWGMHSSQVQKKDGVERVKAYLGKTLFSLPITSSRIESIDEGKCEVKFKHRLKGADNKAGTMNLKFDEFLKRLSMHIQPKYFKRVRNFGFLSCNVKSQNLKAIFIELECEYNDSKNKEIQSMTAKEFIDEYTEWELPCCPKCSGELISMEEYDEKYKPPPDQVALELWP